MCRVANGLSYKILHSVSFEYLLLDIGFQRLSIAVVKWTDVASFSPYMSHKPGCYQKPFFRCDMISSNLSFISLQIFCPAFNLPYAKVPAAAV